MSSRTQAQVMAGWQEPGRPRVSCCCITYNQEKFIRQTLDGMLAQETDFPFEIVVRDDASTDATPAILQDYATRFPDVVVCLLERENQLSRGIRPMPVVLQRARGRYLALCEGDDYWTDPRKLARQAKFLDRHAHCALVYGACDAVDAEGRVLNEGFFRGPPEYSSDQMITGQAYIPTSTVMFRNVIEPAPDAFRNTRHGDVVFWHQLGFHGNARYLEDVGASCYRRHAGGMYSGLDEFERLRNTVETRMLLKRNLGPGHRLEAEIDRAIRSLVTGALCRTAGKARLGIVAAIWKYAVSRVGIGHGELLRALVSSRPGGAV